MPRLPDEGRKEIHRASPKYPDGEARWCALQELLDQLVNHHKIDDPDALADAVDTAALIYHHSRSPLSQEDREQLLASIPKVAAILSREENDNRIAEILMDRDARFLSGTTWCPDSHVATVIRIRQIEADLSRLARVLGRPGAREPDMKLHRTVLSLERYWSKRRHRAKFLRAVIAFIAPDDVGKLPSATRHRLRRLDKRRP